MGFETLYKNSIRSLIKPTWINALLPRSLIFIGMVLLLSACEFSSDASPTPNSDSVYEQYFSVLIAWTAPLLAYLILRPFSVHLVLRNMMKSAPGVKDLLEKEYQEMNHGPGDSNIDFLELDRTSDVILNSDLQARYMRALKTGRRTWFVYAAGVLVFTTVAMAIWALVVRPNLQDSSTTLDDKASAAAGMADQIGAIAGQIGTSMLGVALPIILGFCAILLLGASFAGYQMTGRLPLWSSALGFIFVIVGWFIAGTVLSIPFALLVLPTALAAAILVYGYQRIYKAGDSDGNLQLLVLRVFDVDRSTAFIFGRLIRKWRHLGSYITVVDPSYIRHQFSLSSPESRAGILRIVAIYGALITLMTLIMNGLAFVVLQLGHSPFFAAWRDIGFLAQNQITGIFAWLVLISLSFLAIAYTVNKLFIQTSERLENTVRNAHTQKMKWDATFPGYPMYCFDNVWRRAINSLLNVSDVVLMDLRGYSAERRGCEYEIGLLVENFPLQRTVFLVDSDSKSFIKKMIRQRIQSVPADSPNRGLDALVTTLYCPGVEEDDDIPRIVKLLSASTAAANNRPPLLTVPVKKQNRFLTMLLAPFKLLGRTVRQLSLNIDTMVGTPKYSKVVMPLSFVCLALLLAFHLPPLWQAIIANQPVVVDIATNQVTKGTIENGTTASGEIEIIADPPVVVGKATNQVTKDTVGNDSTSSGEMESRSKGDLEFILTDSPGELLVLIPENDAPEIDVWIEGQQAGRTLPNRISAFQTADRWGREYVFKAIKPGSKLKIVRGVHRVKLPFELKNVPVERFKFSFDPPPWRAKGGATTSVDIDPSQEEVQVHSAGYIRQGISFDARGGLKDRIEIHTQFKGGVTELATQFGNTSSFKALIGESVPVESVWVQQYLPRDKTGLDLRSAMIINNAENQHEGIALVSTFPNPNTNLDSISSLEGQINLQVPDPSKIETIDNITEKALRYHSPGSTELPLLTSAWGWSSDKWMTVRDGKTIRGRFEGRIAIRGGVANIARKVGKFKVHSALGESNDALDISIDNGFFGRDKEYSNIVRTASNSILLEFDDDNIGTLEQIKELSGSMEFMVPDPAQTITIRNINELFANAQIRKTMGIEQKVIQLNHELLAQFGKVSLVRYSQYPDSLNVEIEVKKGTTDGKFDAHLVHPKGTLSPSGSGSSRFNNKLYRSLSFQGEYLENLEGISLELVLGYTVEKVAFALRDIPIEKRN